LRSMHAVIALLAVLVTSTAQAAADGAREWVQRMNEALATRNYEGVLVRQVADTRVVLRIVHRVQDGKMAERVSIVSGPAAGFEFVRNGSKWVAFDPMHRVARKETRNRSYGYLIALNGLSGGSSRYYDVTDGGATRIDGRSVQRVSVEPRDAVRYGYRFWLDAKTALPLKTQLVSRSGEVLDDISFLSITLPEKITDERFRLDFETRDFRWMDGNVPMHTPGFKKGLVPRRELLPAGFRVLMLNSAEEEAKAPGPRTRFLVSDGIAWVSVFIERAEPVAAPKDTGVAKDSEKGKDGKSAMAGRPDGVVVMGASSTYVTLVDGFRITATGEVPPSTVKTIAGALQPE
jgi:sigma-E factor negative regulatory protein RseB